MTNPVSSSPRTPSRTCCAVLAVILALTAAVLLMVIAILRPDPAPPDYARIPIVTDHAWDTITAQEWQAQARTGQPPSIAVLSDAPISPLNVLAMPFAGTQPDTEPSVVWRPMPTAREVYAEWWMKVSANWECNPAGCGKIAFLFPASGGGDLYQGIYCATSNGTCPSGTFTPMQFAGQLQFGAYAGTPIFPNVTTTPIDRDHWYHYAFYVRWSSTPEAHDGVWRWWVDDVLNGEYTDIAFAMGPATEFQFAMTKQTIQDPPDQFVWFDHTIIRATPGGPMGVATGRRSGAR
jgi:hypothetical protein